jgi:hypothetical protein
MGITFAPSETAKLSLSDGAWILVRRRLNAGEQRQLFSRLVKRAGMDAGGDHAPRVEMDIEQVGLSTILAYLLDWSAADQAPIRGASLDVIQSALNALDSDSYNEILAAITQHEQAMAAERAQEKKRQAGGSASSPISPSPFAAIGATTG